MKDVSILTKDASLFTLLSLELERMGKTVGGEDSGECRLLIVDIDSVDFYSLKYKKKIVISRYGETAGDCELFLHRPVHVGELREGVIALLEEKRRKVLTSAEKRDRISLSEDERAVLINQKKIRLSEKEFLLFTLLFGNRGRAVGREALGERIGASGNEVDVYICYLRRKLERGGRRLILTERGVGYKLI